VSGLYTVNVTANGCTSSFSTGFNFIVTGINSPSLNRKITIFPGPVRDYLYIKYSGNDGSFEVSLFDISGKKLFENGRFNTTYQLDLRKYNAGPYIVQIISTRNREQIQKLIIKL